MNSQRRNSNIHLPYIFTAEWTSYLVFSIIFVPLIFFTGLSTIKNPTFDKLGGLLFISCFYFGFVLWLSALKVEVLEDRLKYSSLFTRGVEIFYSDIQAVEVSIGLDEESLKKSAFYRFNVYDYSQFYDKPLTINMKPFSKKDLIFMARTILSKNQNIKVNNLAKELAESNFEIIVSTGVKRFMQGSIVILFVFVIYSVIKVLITQK